SVSASCRECGREIAKFRAEAPRNSLAWCLECLGKHPEATFGERLKSHRLAAGMTQRELAEKVRLRQPSIAHYEADKGLPRQGNLAKLTRALGAGFRDHLQRSAPLPARLKSALLSEASKPWSRSCESAVSRTVQHTHESCPT